MLIVSFVIFSKVLNWIVYRLGQVDQAQRHMWYPGQQPDPSEIRKLQTVEKHLNRCTDARKVGDWKTALREGDAAIAAGADSSPQVKP